MTSKVESCVDFYPLPKEGSVQKNAIFVSDFSMHGYP